jgi:hypothetical protein
MGKPYGERGARNKRREGLRLKIAVLPKGTVRRDEDNSMYFKHCTYNVHVNTYRNQRLYTRFKSRRFDRYSVAWQEIYRICRESEKETHCYI